MSKSYILSEIMKQLKERYQLSPHEVETELQRLISQEPKYLILPNRKTIKLSEKK